MFNNYSNNYFNNYFNDYFNKTVTHQIQKGDCLMEIRKFIVELHTDGSMTWSEYTEPNSREDLDLICSRAFQRAVDYLETYPCSHYSPAAKAAYLAGAARAAAILRKTL